MPKMSTTNGSVLELVENHLAVPFPQFMEAFSETLEPILLSQPGVISVMTGFVLAKPGQDPTVAVSLTQWQSLEAHNAFLSSPSAAPFFKTVQPLTRGPPSIQHLVNDKQLAPQAIGSSYAFVAMADDRAGHVVAENMARTYIQKHGPGAAITGQCVEVDKRLGTVLFGNHAVGEVNRTEFAESYVVSWQKNSAKRREHNL